VTTGITGMMDAVIFPVFCCDTNASVSNMRVRRAGKTAEELAAALNKALRAHDECVGIKVLKLTPLSNVQVGFANWDVEFAAEPGTTMSPECKRAALGVKHGVQKYYDFDGGG
jgi:hypothetical protein